MELLIDLRADCPIYEQIYEFIKNEIKSGHILTSTKLPSTRRLSQDLKVSRTTVVNAYEQLLAEGYLKSKAGSGYIVNKLDDMDILKKYSGLEKRTDYIPAKKKTKGKENKNLIDFSPTKIDLRSFPYASWRSIARKVFSNDRADVFTAGDNQGEYGLRCEIATYLHTARRVVCTPQNIIVGAGSEYLVLLLGLLLGSRYIALENPGYIKARQIFESMAWNISSIDMDDEGMDINKLKRSRADICYLMPANQYPTGVIMPINRRRELITWCYEKTGRYIIEDDYDSEFRFVGKPIPAMQGLDPQKVIYIGTFSKSIAPAIRVAYMVLPDKLMEEYESKLDFFSCTVPRSDQDILEIFIREGYFERHLNRMRTNYRAKRDILIESIQKNLSRATVFENNSGLHVLMTLEDLSEKEILDYGVKAGVRFYPISVFYTDENKKKSTVLVGFASLKAEDIKKGIEDFSKEVERSLYDNK